MSLRARRSQARQSLFSTTLGVVEGDTISFFFDILPFKSSICEISGVVSGCLLPRVFREIGIYVNLWNLCFYESVESVVMRICG